MEKQWTEYNQEIIEKVIQGGRTGPPKRQTFLNILN